MNDLNNLSLVGRITRDSELRYAASGTAICSFSIAVNRSVKKGDNWEYQASFIDLSIFNKTAENLNKYLVKGTQVAVTGSLVQDRWEKDGVKQSKLKVSVDHIQLLGGGPRESSASAPKTPQKPAAEDFDPRAYEDGIPF